MSLILYRKARQLSCQDVDFTHKMWNYSLINY